MTEKKQIGRPKKADALSNAERQRRFTAKRRQARAAAAAAYAEIQNALLLGRYQAALAAEIKANPHSRFVGLLTKRVAALEAKLRRPEAGAGVIFTA